MPARINGPVGATNPKAKLTEKQVAIIKGSKRSNSHLANEFGTSATTILRIKSGKLWGFVEPVSRNESDDRPNPALIGNWLPVPGWEGFYDVSDDGRIRSWSRRASSDNDWLLPVLITQRPNRLGYLTVKLWRNQKVATRGVHTLVAEAFIGPRPKGLLVLHGDGKQTNNTKENLRYGTHKDNYEDAVKHGTRKRKNG